MTNVRKRISRVGLVDPVYSQYVKRANIQVQCVPLIDNKETQTEISFYGKNYEEYFRTQSELDSSIKKLALQNKLEEVMNNEGSNALTKRNRLAQTLCSYNYVSDTDIKTANFKVTATHDTIKNDFILILTNYTRELDKSKELVVEINRLDAELNLQRKKMAVYFEAIELIDQKCTEYREKAAQIHEIHSKCKLANKIRTVSQSKAARRQIDDLNTYNDYMLAITELNSKVEAMPVAASPKLKYYYKIVYNFQMFRLDFVKKRSKDGEVFEDAPFAYSFYFETLAILGTSGHYSAAKLKELLLGLLKCQFNTKIMLFCKAIGLIEGEQFNVVLQRKYIELLDIMLDLKDGFHIGFNLEDCSQ